jgi:hypothetical protein
VEVALRILHPERLTAPSFIERFKREMLVRALWRDVVQRDPRPHSVLPNQERGAPLIGRGFARSSIGAAWRGGTS